MGFLGILEKKLLNESASVENVNRAMDNHSKVIINYHSKGKDENTGVRIIEPVAYGLTKSGNPVIRAWQPYGDTTSKVPSWKFFRLDRITYWEETGAKFGDIPDFSDKNLNPDGDNTMSVVYKTYNSTNRNDATNGANIGPKTKEKIFATSGDRQLSLGKSNLERMKAQSKEKSDKENVTVKQPDIFKTSGDSMSSLAKSNLERMKSGLKIDLDNNKKANNGVNNTNKPKPASTVGPKVGWDTSISDNGKKAIENGEINSEDLKNARDMVNQPEPSQNTNDEDFEF